MKNHTPGLSDVTVVLEKMDEIEWDSDKWVIETDQNDWAERIDGADKTYRTPRKLMVGIDGNYKENGIDGLEEVELTELIEFMV